MNNQIRLFEKQGVAWKYLTDEVTREVVYGGGAGGGKTKLGSIWLGSMVASLPGSTWCIGRSELKKIKLSTLVTFRQVLTELGFTDKSYRYDDQKGVLTFKNGSKVVLMDLNYNPSDPEFDRLGSMEFTGAFVDEGQEIDDKARQILNSRLRNLIGPQLGIFKTEQEAKDYIEKEKKGVVFHNEKLNEYWVVLWVQKVPKLFISCNPGRNFIYTDFYKPWKNGELEENKKFVQSLPTDNPFLPPSYIENLKNLDKISRERLLYGNFDYSDDPGLLFLVDDIVNCFKDIRNNDKYYLTIDAARLGKDKTEIGIWKGLHLERIERIKVATLTEQKEFIQKLIDKYEISLDNIIVDEVGVGGGLVDMIGCKGFISNASPLQPYSAKLLEYKKRNYANLKTQAFFYLKQYIENGKVSIYKDCPQKNEIIEELLFIRQIDIDNDSKIKLEGKKELKARLGRSPDIADMLSFRMWWLIKDHHHGITPKEDDVKEEETDEFIQWLMEEDEVEQEELNLEIY